MNLRTLLQLVVVVGLLVSTVGVGAPVALAQNETGPKTADRIDTPLNASAPSFTDQIIIKYRSSAGIETAQAAEADRMQALSAAAGADVSYFREMSGDAHVLRLPQALPESEVTAIAKKLAALPEVEYAEVDRRNYVQRVPNDPAYAQQWHYFAPIAGTYGANLPTAWDITTGSANLIVSVIDTGILFNHPDLAGRIVTGYDFISSSFSGNDGSGRDNDAADPGDSSAANECGPGSSARASSWHGTHVAGTVGAASNNSLGVAGINWASKILPVRALGKCGGTDSDIADAIRWSAGLPVSGVPANATPARVINLSLGGTGLCGATMQSAVTAAVNAGAVVVVAAGNTNSNASNFSPANCTGVITVAANDRGGDKAIYSNFGATVEITAPGGETATPSNGVLSTLNTGATAPFAHSLRFYQGTSMAAPHVAGIVSLMLSVNPSLTPTDVISVVQSTVTSFPLGSSCNTANCGPGIINAGAAVAATAALPGAVLLNQRVFLPLVTNSASGACANSAIQSGNFENTVGWVESSTSGLAQILPTSGLDGVIPLSGGYAVWLGGSLNETGSLEQAVTVGCNALYLSYNYLVFSTETVGSSNDSANVLINGAVVDSFFLSDTTETATWTKRTINLTAYQGQSVTVTFRIVTNGSANSSWFLDDIGFQSTP